MPSKAHDWLTNLFQTGRANNPGPTSLEEERAAMDFNATLVSAPPGVTEEEVAELPGSLLFTPPDAGEDLFIILIHGGGFRVGSPANESAVAGTLARLAGARVLSPEYRLAPEHPYPAGLDDCEAAYLHACELAPDARIVIGGTSAGAGLAAALLLRRRDAGDKRPLAGVLYSGVYDLRQENFTSGSWVDNAASDYVLAPELSAAMRIDYAGSTDPADPGVSPLCADLTGLPPLLIFASSTELLLDDSVDFALKAAKSGVETTLEIWPGMHHGWQSMTGMLPEAAESLERSAAFVHRVADGHFVGGSAVVDDPEILKMLNAS